MRSSDTLSDRLLGAVGLSLFGGLFFGNLGLLAGPLYLILTFLINKFVDSQISSRNRSNRP